MKITLATSNKGKKRELEALFQSSLQSQAVTFQTLEEAGICNDIEETGKTFAENALIKAQTVAEQTGGLALADDSGLSVNILAGEPGIFSARYAGPPYSDERNRKKLLEALAPIPWQQRQAFFTCVLCLYGPSPNQGPWFLEGQCHGFITLEPKGTLGFGYDSLFVPREEEWNALSLSAAQRQLFFGKTFAEIPAHLKNQLSHRGKAVAKLQSFLLCLP